MNQDFVIRQWNVFPVLESEDESLTPADILSSIPKMLKRRLTPLARTVFCAAIPCISETNIPTVFSSTHGELAKSFKMMEMIEQGEEISPTAFSLSVHNAIAGLFSMAFKNKLQTTVVAPGEEGIAPAFIEALGLLEEGAEEVLIVLYDEPLVDFYPSDPYQLSAAESCAVALRIAKTATATDLSLNFSCQLREIDNDDGEQPMQLPLLIRFLAESQASLVINTPRHSWHWLKQ